jgi:hypothetical protein
MTQKLIRRLVFYFSGVITDEWIFPIDGRKQVG